VNTPSGSPSSGATKERLPRKRSPDLADISGPALKNARAQPANALIVNGRVYIIDAGNGVARQMALTVALGPTPNTVRAADGGGSTNARSAVAGAGRPLPAGRADHDGVPTPAGGGDE
jgi:hypothetical protein